MHLTTEQFEKSIQKKLKTNQFLLWTTIAIALIIFFFNTSNYLWAIYFIGIGSLSLQNITKCKEDRQSFKKNKLEKVNGIVLDCFPETEDESKNWIIFVMDLKTNEVHEFIVPAKPDVEINQTCEVSYTPRMKLLVRIS